MTRSFPVLMLALAAVLGAAESGRSGKVRFARVPAGGMQPQTAQDEAGVLHMVYLGGDPKTADVFYSKSSDEGRTFSKPVRVNSEPGSAVGMGTIRGAQIATGRNGRVHIAWNGAKGMLYARTDGSGAAFEPQRNLMSHTSGLDGGGSIAADGAGNVYVGWHGRAPDAVAGEAGRQVWIARSADDGKTFGAEQPAWSKPTGACACCGMKLFADREGVLYAMYRSATENVHRDIYLLVSRDHGKSFDGHMLHPWEINACPMSSMSFTADGGVAGAWETGGQVYFAPARGGAPVAAPGEAKNRKHPRLARNRAGETILVWTEGTGWQRGGSVAWQVYDRDLHATADHGTVAGLPVWDFAAVSADGDNGFTILY